MDFWKRQLLTLVSSARYISKKSIKIAVITAVAVSAIIFSHGPMALAQSSKLTTIYYVYLNNLYIGTASNKNSIKNALRKRAEKVGITDNDSLLAQVIFIPEETFNAKIDNAQTIKILENIMATKRKATAISLDGRQILYVDSHNTADQVIKNLELKYVSAQQLKELVARKALNSHSLPPLNENETRLLDVHFSKKVTLEDVMISPGEIISANQAITFLQKGTLEEKKYTVKDGDVLGSIANEHQLTLKQFLALNPGLTEDSVLKIGQEVNITVPKPFLEVMVEKEVNQKESIPYHNQVINDSSMPKGETNDRQAGSNGLQSVIYSVMEGNGQAIKKVILKSVILKQPVNHIIINGTKVIPSRGEGSFTWPTVGGYISSTMGYRWGKFHKGIDIARPSNYTIKAADNGVVIFAGWDGSYGNKIEIDHQNGYHTVYGHLSSIKVHVGQTVEKGSAIGIMGATGDATGVHLHFEVYKNGGLKNPLSYLRG
ncbi:MAG: peptidoglycan DD-metalloendopeptidase family protein [Bacillota bacterium]|nr:peptidoglycan DD-metalloendopeptidase family protein [Bacillota bacterium]